MIVRGRDHDHAIEGNVRRKAMEMRRTARRVPRTTDLAATAARFTDSVIDRIAQGGVGTLMPSGAFIGDGLPNLFAASTYASSGEAPSDPTLSTWLGVSIRASSG